MRFRSIILILLLASLLSAAVSAEDALEWTTMGQNAATAGNYNGAITYYDNALREDPNYASAWAGRAAALNALSKFPDALTSADQALVYRQQDPVALQARADALFGMKNYTYAVRAYDAVIKVRENSITSYCNQGYAYVQLNKSASAIAPFDRCTALDPLNFVSWDHKGQAYMDLGDYDAALRMYNQGTSIAVNNATLWNHKGLAYVALGMPTDAIECFSKAVGIDARYTEAKTNREMMLGRQQNINISGTITPVPTISRIGTFYTTATPTPPPTSAVTETPQVLVPETTLPVSTAIPEPKRTTYSPVSLSTILGGVLAAGAVVLLVKKP